MKKLRIILMNIAKKNLIFRKIARNTLNTYRYVRYKTRGVGKKTNNKMILFSSFNGKSYADSPKAIYKYMKDDERFKDYIFIWAAQDPDKYEALKNEKNTILVKQGSKKYEEYFSTAKYWFCNHRVLDHIKPKKDQIYVQCWHGTPLKKLGYDLTNGNNALNTTNEMKFKYKSDAKKFKYMLSPSKFATEKFISAFNLKDLNKEDCIIEEGYPRNDFLFNYTDEDLENIKEKLGIDNINKKIILYAPTWRDDQHKSGIGYTYEQKLDFDKLKEKIGNEYIILFRAHYFVANKFNFEKYKGFVYDVSGYDDINELYIISDILITDYSSVFFDYANLKRPIIYYMYDFDEYKNDLRGFYIDIDDLPGKIVMKEDDLVDQVLNIEKEFKYDDKYKRFNEKYNYLDDGNASKRVVNKIIK